MSLVLHMLFSLTSNDLTRDWGLLSPTTKLNFTVSVFSSKRHSDDEALCSLELCKVETTIYLQFYMFNQGSSTITVINNDNNKKTNNMIANFY